MNILSILNTYLLYITVSILPFIWWPWAAVTVEVPRVHWFLAMTSIVLILSINQLKAYVPTLFHKSIVFKVTLLFLFAATVSTLLSNDVSKGIIGNYYRADGLISLFGLVTFSLLISYYKQFISRHVLALAWFIPSVIISMWSLIDRIYVIPELRTFGLWPDPSSLSFGNPNFLAGYLLISLPFGWYLWNQCQTSMSKSIISSALLISVLGIVISQSIGAIGGLVVLVLLVLLARFSRKVWISALVLGVLALITIFYVKEINTSGYVAEGRPRIFTKLLLSMAHEPLIGYGLAQVDTAFDSVVYPYYMKGDVYLDKAHSTILEVFVTTGSIGLMIFGSIYVLLFRRIGKLMKNSKKPNDLIWHKTLFVTLIIFLLHSQTNIISINEELIFWIILGWYY